MGEIEMAGMGWEMRDCRAGEASRDQARRNGAEACRYLLLSRPSTCLSMVMGRLVGKGYVLGPRQRICSR